MREFGPVEAPLADPPDYVIPRMAPDIVIARATVWRVAEPELGTLGDWLVTKLRRSWPNLNDGSILYWFRTCAAARDMLFVRTENVCALMQAQTSILEPLPLISEIFCESKEGVTHDECFALYRFVVEWGFQIKAREFMFFPPGFSPGQVGKDRARASRPIPVIGDEILANLKKRFDDRISIDKRYGNVVRME